MRKLLIIALFLIGCEKSVVGPEKYKTLEIDMREFCSDKSDGYYYVGPKNGYRIACTTRITIAEGGPFGGETISFPQTIDYILGKGFALECPDNDKIQITWD